MNPTAASIAVATTFIWLGMILAISFLEAPLKFRARGVSIPIGLAIGRLVFRALNLAEISLAAIVIGAFAAGGAPAAAATATAVAAGLLTGQLALIRPRLNRRSDRVLEGEQLPRSRGHQYYIGCESAKAVALLVLGVTLLADIR
jgi:hypothetical protein